jgi:hypothetical protein
MARGRELLEPIAVFVEAYTDPEDNPGCDCDKSSTELGSLPGIAVPADS